MKWVAQALWLTFAFLTLYTVREHWTFQDNVDTIEAEIALRYLKMQEFEMAVQYPKHEDIET